MPLDNDVIYLDHAATTPTDPRVLSAMLPWFTDRFGNPSSIYQSGQDGRAAVDRARSSVSRILGVPTTHVLFTSGATESDNLALSGVAWQRWLEDPDAATPHVITSVIEHHAVLHAAEWLRRVGFAVTCVPCDSDGIVDPDDVRAAITPQTCLVSIMSANNESGAIQPIAEIATIMKEAGIPFHCDAVQSAGSLAIGSAALPADMISLSAHKFYGPKGVGILAIPPHVPIAWQQHGGGQEGGRRGGTENVPGIVGLAAALEIAEAERATYVAHCAGMRDRLWIGIQELIPDALLNGPADMSRRLPNNLNVAFPGIQGETVLLALDMQGVAASAGSACTTGNSQPSHVLTAMGLTAEQARASLRLTVGRSTTVEDIDDTIEILAETIKRVRRLGGG